MGLKVRGHLVFVIRQALCWEFYMNHSVFNPEHTQGPLTHKGGDIKTDSEEGKATRISTGGAEKVKGGKRKGKEDFPGKGNLMG